MPRQTKKNAQGAGTIRKRSDGRRETRYTTGFDPAAGKQTQRSILPSLGHVPLSQPDPHRIQSFYNALLRGKGEKKPLRSKSIRNVHGILSKCLSTAVKLEYMRRNPAEVVTLPRVGRKEIMPLTNEQVRALLTAIGDDVKAVRSNLDHATAAFTLDVYGHVSERMKEGSADRMQMYIKNL